jgi:hypothetical protein
MKLLVSNYNDIYYGIHTEFLSKIQGVPEGAVCPLLWNTVRILIVDAPYLE